MKYCGPEDPDHPKKFDDPPMEVELLMRLAGNSDHISALRNYRVSDDRTEYWVIMDFAPFGDLSGFWWDYAKKGYGDIEYCPCFRLAHNTANIADSEADKIYLKPFSGTYSTPLLRHASSAVTVPRSQRRTTTPTPTIGEMKSCTAT